MSLQKISTEEARSAKRSLDSFSGFLYDRMKERKPISGLELAFFRWLCFLSTEVTGGQISTQTGVIACNHST